MKSRLFNSLLRHRIAACTALAMVATITSARAAPITIVNGSFEQTLVSGSYEFGTAFPTQEVTGWTTGGYNFVFQSGTADTSGATSQYGIHDMKLWGPGDGSNNGLPVSSPDGGNYLGLDGAFSVQAVSQMIYGLTPGQAATVTFYYAGAQQHGYTGLNTEQFEVSLGTQHLYTPVLNNTSEGFTGWQSETMTFIPTVSTELLSFFAIGTPSGVPPFSLLDGVTMSSVAQTPEPSSLALLVTGLTGVGSLVRARLKRNNL
jgi:hypothetical protein